MFHSIDVYSFTDSTRDASGHSTQVAALSHGSVPACVQPVPSQVLEEYKGRDERVTHVAFYTDPDVTIDFGDRIVFESTNYRVIGRKDAVKLGRVFRADLEIEQS